MCKLNDLPIKIRYSTKPLEAKDKIGDANFILFTDQSEEEFKKSSWMYIYHKSGNIYLHPAFNGAMTEAHYNALPDASLAIYGLPMEEKDSGPQHFWKLYSALSRGEGIKPAELPIAAIVQSKPRAIKLSETDAKSQQPVIQVSLVPFAPVTPAPAAEVKGQSLQSMLVSVPAAVPVAPTIEQKEQSLKSMKPIIAVLSPTEPRRELIGDEKRLIKFRITIPTVPADRPAPKAPGALKMKKKDKPSHSRILSSIKARTSMPAQNPKDSLLSYPHQSIDDKDRTKVDDISFSRPSSSKSKRYNSSPYVRPSAQTIIKKPNPNLESVQQKEIKTLAPIIQEKSASKSLAATYADVAKASRQLEKKLRLFPIPTTEEEKGTVKEIWADYLLTCPDKESSQDIIDRFTPSVFRF